jgi:hypothetical protein
VEPRPRRRSDPCQRCLRRRRRSTRLRTQQDVACREVRPHRHRRAAFARMPTLPAPGGSPTDTASVAEPRCAEGNVPTPDRWPCQCSSACISRARRRHSDRAHLPRPPGPSAPRALLR